MLFKNMVLSGCAKKQIGAATLVGGELRLAYNTCAHQDDACPRMALPSSVGYDLCQAKHAKARPAELLAGENKLSDGVARVAGHFWACEPYASALRGVGVKEIRVLEFPR